MWKKNTFRNYEFILSNFQNHFGDIELSSITSENILAFMTEVSDGTKQSTKKLRFTLLAAFFNYIKNSVDPDFQNPCDNPALRKLFRAGKLIQFKILEKDVVDEIIFRTPNPRNRLMLELMARACMRVGEVLKLKAKDIEGRKVTIRYPKSGKEAEVAFLPQKVADRLQKFTSDNGIKPEDRIFSITHAMPGSLLKRLVNLWTSGSDLMFCVDTPPHMPAEPGNRLKSFRKCCYAIRTYQPLKFIWEKSAMQRRCGGLITCMPNVVHCWVDVRYPRPSYLKDGVSKSIRFVSVS